MRKKTRQIKAGRVRIGGGAPVSIQSMTKTDTRNTRATIAQIKRLEKAGCEIIRVAVKDTKAALSLKKIKKAISIPLEVDIHFDYRLAILAAESGADAIRINPGNISKLSQVQEIINACKKRKIPIRIGVNSGSLPITNYQLPITSRMVKTVTRCLKIFERNKFYDIMISLKASDVKTTIEAYRKISSVCNYPLHLGVTATGSGTEAIIKSAIGIGTLLADGIGDTIRVSLTGDPEDEVYAAKAILQSLGLRRFGHEIISCPTCGRCQIDLVKIVERLKFEIRNSKFEFKKPFRTVAVMGCEVNGPGEAKEADAGIAFGSNYGVIFKKGKIIKRVKAKDAVRELLLELRRKS